MGRHPEPIQIDRAGGGSKDVPAPTWLGDGHVVAPDSGWSLAVCEVDLVVGGEALSTLVLTELGGTTTLTSAMTYASRGARDAVLRTPMKQGMAIGYDRLAVLIATSGSNS